MGPFQSFMLILSFSLIGFVSGEYRLKPGIVDGAGYAIKNSAFLHDDLTMQANPAPFDESVGQVSLEPFTNAPSQKWGVEYYGGSTAALTPGMNRDNFVTVYFPSGFTRPHSRQYTFESTDGNETFKIKNSETKQCLHATQTGSSYLVDFASCDDASAAIYWVFQRNG